ncbi:MAG: NADPH-dependent FMN reductase [Rhodospirillales bacterium]|nr:NADPH-dependent FMN reductase [Rhodospirillales bacterium]
MSLDLVVVYGSVRSARQGIKLARFLVRELEDRGHRPHLIDPLEVRLPLLDRMYKEYLKGEAPAAMEDMGARLRKADGFVIVSGEYNHGIPPALKNLLDHFLEEWFWRPSAIACYSAGAFGGVRAAMQLRATLAELGMPSIPSLYPVPKVGQQFDEDGVPLDDGPKRRVGRFLAEFEWYAKALKAARAGGLPY